MLTTEVSPVKLKCRIDEVSPVKLKRRIDEVSPMKLKRKADDVGSDPSPSEVRRKRMIRFGIEAAPLVLVGREEAVQTETNEVDGVEAAPLVLVGGEEPVMDEMKNSAVDELKKRILYWQQSIKTTKAVLDDKLEKLFSLPDQEGPAVKTLIDDIRLLREDIKGHERTLVEIGDQVHDEVCLRELALMGKVGDYADLLGTIVKNSVYMADLQKNAEVDQYDTVLAELVEHRAYVRNVEALIDKAASHRDGDFKAEKVNQEAAEAKRKKDNISRIKAVIGWVLESDTMSVPRQFLYNHTTATMLRLFGSGQ